MSELIEAEIRAWIECRRCGRIDKPPVPILLPAELAFSATEKVCARCERCHGHALMILERAVRRLH
jgi:Zn finger protein HypA/HybF involved in hydrogenase expression